jgi:hypothetical protein
MEVLWCGEAKCCSELSHIPLSFANSKAFLVLRTASGEFETMVVAHSNAVDISLFWGTTVLTLAAVSVSGLERRLIY